MAEEFPPTPDQQKVIDLCDRTVLLSAAAGSGKTKTLTNRLIKMITREKDPLDVTRMLVTTFTRAAAEELRTRISNALKEAVAERPDDERLKKQLLLLPTARIRTINAFCNDLVKGHTDELGISPFYRIADEAELDLIAYTILDDVIEDAYNGTYAPEGLDIVTLVELAESAKENGTLANKLYNLYKYHLHDLKGGVARLHADALTLAEEADLPFFETRAGRALAAHYKDLALHAHDLLCMAFEELKAPRTENVIFKTLSVRYFYLLSTAKRVAEACDESYEALLALTSAYHYPECDDCPRGYKYAEEETRYKALLEHTNKFFVSFFKSLTWTQKDLSYAFMASSRVTESLYLIFREFEERFTAEKKRRAICDHSDTVAYAYRLLLDENDCPTPLALELRDSFDAICVDEYQDVNDIQHKIFKTISTERNLFMVGDIKQSIYAFRGAVPKIFADLRKSFPSPEEDKENAVLYLSQNFRSEKPVIDFDNDVFNFLFGIIRDAIGYVEESDKLIHVKKSDELKTKKPEGTTPLPVFYLMEKESKKGKSCDIDPDADASARKEEDLIAEKVVELLTSGRLKDGRRITPKDIAILIREHSEPLIAALQARGIPIKRVDKTDYFSRPEILLALCLTHSVNNPHRDIYLGGLLRSPLYGFRLEDLTTIRAEHRNGSLYDALVAHGESHPEDAQTQRVLFDLGRFRAMAENLPSHRVIRAMFREVGIYAATDADGRANLRSFYELARAFEASSFRGLYRFLDHINEVMAHGSKGMPDRDKGSEEAVTVTTIHGSKGLEYPVCILAYMGKELKKKEKSFFAFTEELGVVSRVLNEDGSALLSTPILDAHDIVKKKGEIEEEVRVLYVALTRPKERLYMFGFPSGNTLTSTLLESAKRLRLAPSATALHIYSNYALWVLAAFEEGKRSFHLVKVPPPYVLEPEETPVVSENGADGKAPAAEKKRFRARFSFSLLEEMQKKRFMRAYSKRFSFRYPHEKESLLPAKLSVSALYPGVLDELSLRSPFDPTFEEMKEMAEEKEFTPSIPAFLSDVEEKSAALAGTATHLFLQFCKFERILTAYGSHSEVIEKELETLYKGKFMTLEDIGRVRVSELEQFLDSDLAAYLREAKDIKKEFRFHAMLPAKNFSLSKDDDYDGFDVFVQGVIDLLVIRPDGSLLLVDYKTDRLPKGADEKKARDFLFERHGSQLSIYASAVEKIFGKAPSIAIYSLPLGKLVYREET